MSEPSATLLPADEAMPDLPADHQSKHTWQHRPRTRDTRGYIGARQQRRRHAQQTPPTAARAKMVACMGVLKSLMEEPDALPFLKPVDPEKDEIEDYLEVIKVRL